MIIIKQLPKAAITRLNEIERAEKIDLIYRYEAGRLVEERGVFDSPNWGQAHIEHLIALCRPHLAGAGVLLGALDGQTLAGVAVLGDPLFGRRLDQLQLVLLHVSRAYRRQGVARQLMAEAVKRAKQRGAAYLYISATPSRSAVGFYLSQGCEVAKEVDPELFALEPEDIHLIKRLEAKKA